jgi:putative acetyltransferase
MIELIRTDSNNKDFIELVKHLDADLAERDRKKLNLKAHDRKFDFVY